MLKIENFGPIESANLSNRPITILIGPNKSGKSFTALLWHALSNPIKDSNKYFEDVLSDLSFDSFIQLENKNSDIYFNFKKKFNKFLKSKENNNEINFEISETDFETLINEGIGEIYTNLVENSLIKTFNVTNLDKLIGLKSDSFVLNFKNVNIIKKRNEKIKISNLLDVFGLNFPLNSDNGNSLFRIEKGNKKYIIFVNYLLYNKDNINFTNMVARLYSFISRSFFNCLISSYSYYIPSARDELIKNKNSTLSENLKDNYKLSYIQKDFAATILNNIDNLEEGIFYNLACKLEKDLLDGKIIIRDINGNNEFFYINKNYNIDLTLNLVSSSISESIPLIFYLKYVLKVGDTLIIEEPEAHLHPANQRKLVKYFIEASNLGLNIMFTTHSDFISDQFSNHLRLANVSKNSFKEKFNEYSDIDILNPYSIGIYNYKYINPFLFKVWGINIDSTGFDEDNFSSVTSDLYDETVKLSMYKGDDNNVK